MSGKLRRPLVVLLALSFLMATTTGCGDSDKPSQATASGQSARSKPCVASGLREPFHKSSCRWAARINSENIIGYDTKDQAIADGHRPCKVRKP